MLDLQKRIRKFYIYRKNIYIYLKKKKYENQFLKKKSDFNFSHSQILESIHICDRSFWIIRNFKYYIARTSSYFLNLLASRSGLGRNLVRKRVKGWDWIALPQKVWMALALRRWGNFFKNWENFLWKWTSFQNSDKSITWKIL